MLFIPKGSWQGNITVFRYGIEEGMVFSLGSWCMELKARGGRKIILDCRNNFLHLE